MSQTVILFFKFKLLKVYCLVTYLNFTRKSCETSTFKVTGVRERSKQIVLCL